MDQVQGESVSVGTEPDTMSIGIGNSNSLTTINGQIEVYSELFYMDGGGGQYTLSLAGGDVDVTASSGLHTAAEVYTVTASGAMVLATSNVLTLGCGANQGIVIKEGNADVIAITPDANGVTSFVVANGPTSVLFTSGNRSTTGVGAPWTFRAQRGNGNAGGDFIYGGGIAGTSGTHKAGNTRVVVGNPIGDNTTAKFQVEQEDSTKLFTIRKAGTGHIVVQAGDSDSALIGSIYQGSYVNYEPSQQVAFSSPLIYMIAGTSTGAIHTRISPATGRLYLADQGGNVWETGLMNETATINTATTTTTVCSYATSTNFVYTVLAWMVVTNDTDDQGCGYLLFATFRNVGGTLTQIGTTTVLGNNEDTNQSGLTPVLDASGTDIRARLTTDSTDVVKARAKITALQIVRA